MKLTPEEQVRKIREIMRKPERKKENTLDHFSLLDKFLSIDQYLDYSRDELPEQTIEFINSLKGYYRRKKTLTKDQLACLDEIIIKNEIPIEEAEND